MDVLHREAHRSPRQCLIPLPVLFKLSCRLEVSRERVFLLATKPKFNFEAPLIQMLKLSGLNAGRALGAR